MKRILITILIATTLFFGLYAYAQIGGGGIGPAMYWYGDGTGIFTTDSAWHLGSNAIRIAKGWFTDLDVSGVFTLGGTVGPGGIDLNGNPLILDVDGDTQIIADTDDTIDFDFPGEPSAYQFTAAELSLSGDIAMQDDQYLYLDTAGTKGIKYNSATSKLELSWDLDLGGNNLTNIADLQVNDNFFVDSGFMISWDAGGANSTGIDSTSTKSLRLTNSDGEPGAILDATNIATSDKTFQFPNITGTLLTTNGALANVDLGAYDFTVNTNTLFVDASEGRVGIGTDSPDYKLSIASPDGSDQIGIYPSNSDAFIKWTDGRLLLETVEGDNANTIIIVQGHGTGNASIKFNNGETGLQFILTALNSYGGLSVTTGTEMAFQQAADAIVTFFRNANEGETPELKISGFRTGDVKRTLEIGVGVDADDTASFDGVSNYYFDGNVGIGTTTPPEKLTVRASTIIGSTTADGGNSGTTACASGGTFTGYEVLNYKIEIDAGDPADPNTFKWSDDGGSTWDVETVNITGSAQTLNNGVTVTFDSTTSAVTGDIWTFSTTVEQPLLLEDESGNDLMTVLNNGNVGIGTTTPADNLYISDTDNAYITIDSPANNMESALKITMNEAGNNFWWIGMNANPTLSMAYGPTFLDSNTRMVIEEGGNVGIGTTSPGEKLQVSGNIKLYDNVPQLLFYDTNEGANDKLIRIVSDNEKLYFAARNDANNNYDDGGNLLVLDRDGNVGIGVTDPDTKLEVFNAGDQLKLSFDADNFATLQADASGDLHIVPSLQYIIIGDGSNTDYGWYFYGNTSQGLIEWNEDDAYFQISGNDATNYTQIATDGTITLHGTARVTKEIVVGAGLFHRGVSAPDDVIMSNGLHVLAFDKNIVQHAHYNMIIPPDFAAGTTIDIQIDWAFDTAEADTYQTWVVEYLLLQDGEDPQGAITRTFQKSVISTGNNDKQLHMTFGTGITGAVADDTLLITLYRDSDASYDTDDLDQDSWLFAFHMHYVSDKLGD